MGIKHLKVRIYGKVQGVSYRASTFRQAKALGIKGFVQNEPDGSVYAELEGASETLDRMLSWCQEGPPLARVDRLTVEEGEAAFYESFSIRR